MDKLTQMVDGNWIDLKAVTSLIVLPAKDEGSYDMPDRLAIQMGGTCLWIQFVSQREAVAERNRLADLVNQATEP